MSEELFKVIDEEEEDELVTDTGDYQKYLTFVSNELFYGINTNHVIEIITNVTAIKVPMVPGFVRGIINLRGQIIPIVDIRLRMGKPAIEYTDKSCIIVIEVDTVFVGIIVDTVSHVIDIDQEKISSMPNNRQELVNGMMTTPTGETLLIMDCEILVNS